MDQVASFWSGLGNVVKTAINPTTPFRALAATVQNPFNPLKQTQAIANLFRGGSSSPRPTAQPTAPTSLPGGFGGAATGLRVPTGLAPGGFGGLPAGGYPPPLSSGPMSPPWPSSMPPGAGSSYYPPPPMPSSSPPMYGPPMPADYGGQTGWDASYGAGGGMSYGAPAGDPWSSYIDPMQADQSYWSAYAAANPYG
jgi:hypothetical protein